MNRIMKGKAYVVGDNIDTDQIIPAQYLMYSLTDENESKLYGRYALSGVPIHDAGLPHGNIAFIEDEANQSEFSLIIAGVNFGCGSSREHAPFALQKAGIKAVIAGSYARIFYRNAVDGGFLIPYETDEKLHERISTGDDLELEVAQNLLWNVTTNIKHLLKSLGDVLPIIVAGGLFAYAGKGRGSRVGRRGEKGGER